MTAAQAPLPSPNRASVAVKLRRGYHLLIGFDPTTRKPMTLTGPAEFTLDAEVAAANLHKFADPNAVRASLGLEPVEDAASRARRRREEQRRRVEEERDAERERLVDAVASAVEGRRRK